MVVDSGIVLEEAEDLVLSISEVPPGDREAVVKAVAQFLDAVLPFDLVLPGPLGQVVERHDDKALEAIIHHLAKVFHADPAKKAARAERRKRRREEREKRKAQRRKEKSNAR